MVVKCFNYLQVSALTSELSLLCFFDKCDFYPHDSFENSGIMCDTAFGTILDALLISLSKNKLLVTGKKIVYIYILDRIRLEKNCTTQFYLPFT